MPETARPASRKAMDNEIRLINTGLVNIGLVNIWTHNPNHPLD